MAKPRLRTNAVHRSLGALAIEINRAIERKRFEIERERLAEIDQQFQVEISGRAGGMTWKSVNLAFDETFYDAPAQRDGDLEEPLFTYGSVIDKGQPVMISAHVSFWRVDQQGNITGATIRIGCFDPTNSGKSFSGRLHVNFQGFAAPDDPDED